jgi:thymidine kinase
MFGSKTSKLLADLDRYERKGFSVVTFKPKIDDRFADEEIVTHSGARRFAMPIVNGQRITEISTHYDVIGIDEAFMIPGSGEAAIDLYLSGKIVLVSSIQLSSNGNPFEEIVSMMPWATRIEVCPAVCSLTGHDAYFTARKGISNGSELQVGGSECYEPMAWPLPAFVNERLKKPSKI